LPICTPADTDGAYRLVVANDRKTSRPRDDGQARAGHAPHRFEIQKGIFIAAGLSQSCRGYRSSDRERNRFRKDSVHPLECNKTPSFVAYAHRDFHFHALCPSKRGSDRLIGFGQSKHGKLLLSLNNMYGGPLTLQYSPAMRTRCLGCPVH
jgi:hypothetical protein